MKRFHTHLKHKNTYKRTKINKAVLNALNKHVRERKSLVYLYAFLCFLCAFCAFCAFLWVKDNIFMPIKTSKRKKVVCLTSCAFYAFYAFCVCIKRLSESRLVTFCTFYTFYAFCAYKKHLSESCLFAFYSAFCALYAFCAYKKHLSESWVKVACLRFAPFMLFVLFMLFACAWNLFVKKKKKLP